MAALTREEYYEYKSLQGSHCEGLGFELLSTFEILQSVLFLAMNSSKVSQTEWNMLEQFESDVSDLIRKYFNLLID